MIRNWKDVVLVVWSGALLLAAWLALYPGWDVVAKAFSTWALKDWIDLLTAVATLAAVIVALFLAGRAERRGKDEKLQLAMLTAAEISVRLEQMVSRLELIRDLFVDDAPPPVDRRNNLRAAHRFAIDRAMLFRRETIETLLPLPNEAAHRIARAMDLLRLIRSDLTQYPYASHRLGDSTLGMLNRRVGRLITEVHSHLRIASLECVKAAKLAIAPIPRVSEE